METRAKNFRRGLVETTFASSDFAPLKLHRKGLSANVQLTEGPTRH
jgi:hypothetical protein